MIRSAQTQGTAFVAGALMLLTGGCGTQHPGAEQTGGAPAAQEKAAAAPVVPAGTEITFRLEQAVSTGDNKAGDDFRATVTGDVLADDGSVLIPSGTAARGVVVKSQRSDGPDQSAVLAVRMESVRLDGDWKPLDAEVVSANPATSKGDSDTETAGKIAIGAAAGAILGKLVGGSDKSVIAGAGAGAVAGAVVALSTRTGDARLAQGATIRVRLDQPLHGD